MMESRNYTITAGKEWFDKFDAMFPYAYCSSKKPVEKTWRIQSFRRDDRMFTRVPNMEGWFTDGLTTNPESWFLSCDKYVIQSVERIATKEVFEIGTSIYISGVNLLTRIVKFYLNYHGGLEVSLTIGYRVFEDISLPNILFTTEDGVNYYDKDKDKIFYYVRSNGTIPASKTYRCHIMISAYKYFSDLKKAREYAATLTKSLSYQDLEKLAVFPGTVSLEKVREYLKMSKNESVKESTNQGIQ